MSKTITIKNALKKFGNNTVIPNLSLKIKNSELFTLLGPSGCGKTTLLRMIAGFNSIEGGEFYFDDKKINDLEVGKRNIGMVFQNYAIFPNMSVKKNVQFGLKYKDMTKKEIEEETKKFLKLVYVDQYADRMPEQLSGGQQQRVALARALVIKPDVLLMDEPLSNLDAKLRVEMRSIIKQIQKEVGITTVYVTHDQEEAMAISDRIGVMKDGTIRHCSTAKNIYHRPKDLFVASFIGKSNILDGKLKIIDGKVFVEFKNGYRLGFSNIKKEEIRPRDVSVSIRPEEFFISTYTNDTNGIKARVKDSVFLGVNHHYFVEIETGETIEIIKQSSEDDDIEINRSILLTINNKKANVFDKSNGESLMMGVKNDLGFLDEGQKYEN